MIRKRLAELQLEGKAGRFEDFFARPGAEGKDAETQQLLKILRAIREQQMAGQRQ
jgi:hypothetical protein